MKVRLIQGPISTRLQITEGNRPLSTAGIILSLNGELVFRPYGSTQHPLPKDLLDKPIEFLQLPAETQNNIRDWFEQSARLTIDGVEILYQHFPELKS